MTRHKRSFWLLRPLLGRRQRKKRKPEGRRLDEDIRFIIPEEDARRLKAMGVAKVYTPKDFVLNMIMKDIVTLVDPKAGAAE